MSNDERWEHRHWVEQEIFGTEERLRRRADEAARLGARVEPFPGGIRGIRVIWPKRPGPGREGAWDLIAERIARTAGKRAHLRPDRRGFMLCGFGVGPASGGCREILGWAGEPDGYPWESPPVLTVRGDFCEVYPNLWAKAYGGRGAPDPRRRRRGLRRAPMTGLPAGWATSARTPVGVPSGRRIFSPVVYSPSGEPYPVTVVCPRCGAWNAMPGGVDAGPSGKA
jgi:hypothetical protein